MHVQFTRIDEAKNDLVLSEKEAWELLNLEEGTLLDGTVKKIFPYGAQVRIGETNRWFCKKERQKYHRSWKIRKDARLAPFNFSWLAALQALKVPIDAEFNFSWLAALLALKVSMAYFHQTARDFVQSNVFLLVGNVCLSHPMLLKSTWTRMEMHKDRVLLLFVTIESKDGAYAVLKLTPMLKKCGILAFSHRLGVFQKAYVHCIVFAMFEDDINLLADHMKDLFNSKTGRIGPKSADLGKVKEIFSKVRLVGCFGFPIIEYKGVRVSGLFLGSDGVPIKELLCGNRVAVWV
ncbi:hypothetical protein ACFX15_002563 [Malus domestica]